MNYISDLEADIKSNFEGGTSLTVDFKSIIKRAFRKMSMKINPSSLKIEKDLYSGLVKENTDDLVVGENMDKFSRMWNLSTGIRHKFRPLNYLKELTGESGNVAVVNKLNYDIVKTYPANQDSIFHLIDNFEDISSFDVTATSVNLIKDKVYSINGSDSILATFTETKTELSKTLDNSISVDDIKEDGVAVFPIFFKELNIQSFKLILTSLNGSTRTITYDPALLQTGLNILDLKLESSVDVGTPTDINKFKIQIVPISGKEQKIYLERAVLHTKSTEKIVFFTNRFVLDSKTMSPKTIPENGADILRLSEDEYEIMIMEASILTGYKATKRKNMTREKQEFKADLREAYQSYTGDSDREARSYNINQGYRTN